MPLYDYHCEECGTFTESRTIELRNEPAECPECYAPAKRLLTAPNLSLMAPTRRKAYTVNERSSHEPRVRNAHSCGSGCGCASPKPGTQAGAKPEPKYKSAKKATARPWMLGH